VCVVCVCVCVYVVCVGGYLESVHEFKV